MPRIEPQTSPEGTAKELLDGVKGKIGMVPNIYATMAHAPSVLKFALSGSETLGEGALSAGLREQIALTTAGYNGCDYCASAHTKIGEGVGLSTDQTQAALKGQAEDEKAQAALTFTLALLKNRGQVSPSDIEAIKAAGYNDGEVIEIIAATAYNIFTNYFNEAIETEVDFPKVSTNDVSKAA